VKLFDEHRVDLAVFAMQGCFEIRPYEKHDETDGNLGLELLTAAPGDARSASR